MSVTVRERERGQLSAGVCDCVLASQLKRRKVRSVAQSQQRDSDNNVNLRKFIVPENVPC